MKKEGVENTGMRAGPGKLSVRGWTAGRGRDISRHVYRVGYGVVPGDVSDTVPRRKLPVKLSVNT